MPTTDGSPPDVSVPEGWERTDSSAETMFDARVVTVTAHTAVYEDVGLRETLAAQTGADATWRFFFASRLLLRPKTGRSKALSKLVGTRANDGFVEQLRDRGFVDVDRVESRRFAVDRTEADLTRYRCRVEVTAAGDRTVPVTAEGYLAVWQADDGFLLAGGAYPLAVEDETLNAGVREHLSPERHREELLALIRSTE